MAGDIKALSNEPAGNWQHETECQHEEKYIMGEGYQLQADGTYLLIRSYTCRTCGKSFNQAVPGSAIEGDNK